jgi:hypothetical protein
MDELNSSQRLLLAEAKLIVLKEHYRVLHEQIAAQLPMPLSPPRREDDDV